jgi:hypothetical protein
MEGDPDGIRLDNFESVELVMVIEELFRHALIFQPERAFAPRNRRADSGGS